MNKKITVKSCILLCLLCIFCTARLYGDSKLEKITAYINYGIDIILDGEVKELKLENGGRVYPISYDGTTYVPIRGVSQLLGIGVDWDRETGNVILTTKEEKVDILQGTEKETSLTTLLVTEEERTYGVNDNVVIADNGISCKLLKGTDVAVKESMCLVAKPEITEIVFETYCDTSCSLNIFNQQGKLLKTYYLKPNEVQKHTFSVCLKEELDFYFIGVLQNSNVENNGTGEIKIYNIYGKK